MYKLNELNELEEKWSNDFKNTLKRINGYVNEYEKGLEDNIDAKNFRNFANWIIKSDISTYDYLPDEYVNIKNNPFQLNDFLGTLHHALLDDGDVCFVIMKLNNKIETVKLLFVAQHSQNIEKYCYELNSQEIASLDEMNLKKINFTMKVNKISEEKGSNKKLEVPQRVSKNDFKFEIHRDINLFIEQVEQLAQVNKIRIEELEKKRVELLSKIKPKF